MKREERNWPDLDTPLGCAEEDLRRCGYYAKSATRSAGVRRLLRIEHRNRVEAFFKWSMIQDRWSIQLRIEHYPIPLFPARACRYAFMNGSKSPSRTRSTSPTSTFVRVSFTNRYG